VNSLRRYFLDNCLKRNKDYFKDKVVLDAGGKKINKRGNFNPEKIESKKWVYFNIDTNTKPDIQGDINNNNFINGEFDVVLMIELLEYMQDPTTTLLEAKRILKKNGYIIFSVPFIHPLHGDRDFDYFRFSDSGIRLLVKKIDMKIVEVTTMGSTLSVIFDILRINFSYNKNIFYKFFYFILLSISPFIKIIYQLFKLKNEYINTGYFVVVKKV
tara:strand:+ start:14 stop:655 length:642 start_codon:yes stop_codon:yes gene_type:complete